MGRISAPHGLKGWIKVQPFTQHTDGLTHYTDWWVGDEGKWYRHRIAEAVVHGAFVVARLEGFDDRDAAAELRGSHVAVPRAAMPVSREKEFYWSDLLGLEVRRPNATTIGVVTKILETGANTVLVVQGEKEVLVPFIDSVIMNVDLEARQLVADWESQ